MFMMFTRTRLRELLHSPAAFGICCLVLSLSLNQGCASPEPLQPTDAGSSASEQKLPFYPDGEQSSASEGARPRRQGHDNVSADPKQATGLPFHAGSRPCVLPSGTLLTVQLENSLSTAKVRAGDAFTASVAAPLTIGGQTLIARGAAVTGRVESAQLQADRPGRVSASGYFRLTLSAITVDGRQLALQTSSLFARGTSQPWNVSSSSRSSDRRPDGVLVQKGRRLTFRLTAPVTLDDPNSMAGRQSSGPIPE
jgi:hypothetical protein